MFWVRGEEPEAMGGMQIFVTGMVGEYIAKIYTEVKRRPRYFIWEELKWSVKPSAWIYVYDYYRYFLRKSGKTHSFTAEIKHESANENNKEYSSYLS